MFNVIGDSSPTIRMEVLDEIGIDKANQLLDLFSQIILTECRIGLGLLDVNEEQEDLYDDLRVIPTRTVTGFRTGRMIRITTER